VALVVMALWASCYPLIAIGLDDAPHLTFATLRALLASAVLIAIAIITRAAWPQRPAEWGWIALAGTGMTGIGYFGMFHGAEFVAPGLATVVSNLQPLIVGLLAALFLGERSGLLGWSGLTLGFLGVAIIAAPAVLADFGTTSLFGLGYVILATTGVAVGNIAIKRLAGRVEAAMAMGLQLLIGAVMLAFLAVSLEDPTQVEWSGTFISSLVGLALPGTALAFWLWQITLSRLEVSQAVAFSFVVPVIGLTVGWAFFDEAVTLITVAGAGLSIIGVYLAARDGRESLD
jgi:drug/metabolite transporter (DMT)-like permease